MALHFREVWLATEMLLALAFCSKDYLIAEKLFRWMYELDGLQARHSLLLLAAKTVLQFRRASVEQAAMTAFGSVFSRVQSNADERGWPMSCNTLFATCYFEIQKRLGGGPFLWIEPDCVPVKSGWIDSLESEYAASGKPFMGCIYEHPFPHLTGCAIYPPNLDALNPKALNPGKLAWDVANREATMKHAHHTEQFQHVWGNFKHNIAPSFPNHASLGLLRPGAVLFHRCKDGSLIDRLRERKRFPKLCSFMARFQNPSNRFQDFDDMELPKLS